MKIATSTSPLPKIKKKILIVDDSIDLRELMAHFLATRGYETAQARNGRLALDYLAKNDPPDLILLDSEMEFMSGTQFLDELELCRPGFLENLPIIGLSGVEKFEHRRIKRSLRKPVDFNKLESAIEMALTSII